MYFWKIFMKLSISNILLLICTLLFWLSTIFPWFYNLWMNSYYLENRDFFGVLLQFIFYSLLHGGVAHLLMNCLFIYYFGNQVEFIIGTKEYLLFFIWNTIFVGIGLLLLASGNTIGISGFAIAVLSYYTLHLRSIGNPEYTGGITAIVINIALGFVPGISLWGHLLWAVFGVIFYFSVTSFKKRA